MDCSKRSADEEIAADKPLFDFSDLTFRNFGLILSAIFGGIALIVSFFLIWRHASHYLKPYEQKHIIRILVMIPIYAVVSFLSYQFYHYALYFEVMRDCYEAFAIASFFTLVCHYIAPNLHEQKEYFRNIEPKNWVWPMNWLQKCTGGEDKGFLRRPRSGLTWFNVIWISVFQYCFIRPFFTFVAVFSNIHGRYCMSSMDPRFAYIWVAGFDALSVTIAMYCLIQFYVQLKDDLAAHRPFLKITSIKLVIFFCFWQSWIISLLVAKDGYVKGTDKIALPDLRVGIPSMLVCVEMAAFSILHIYAFPWAPYDLKRKEQPFYCTDEVQRYAHGPIRALINALNPWDIVKAFTRGLRWLFVGVKKRTEDPSYHHKLGSTTITEAIGHGRKREPHSSEEDDAATELPVMMGKNDGSADSDTANLLSNAQANPFMRQDSFQTQLHGSDDRYANAPTVRNEYGVIAPDSPRRFETQNTSYTGASYYPEGPQYHERDTASNTDWDMFGGATRPAPATTSRPPVNKEHDY